MSSHYFPSFNRTLVLAFLMRSYPIIFSTLNVLALEAVNTIIVSRIDMYQAAAAVLVNTLYNIFKKINAGISVSVSLLVAHEDRKKNYGQVVQILRHALLLNTGFSLIFCLILIVLAFIMKSFSRFPVLISLGRPYLLIIAFALIPSAINNMIRRYLEGVGCGTIGLLLSFFTLITNVGFNFLFLYGRGASPMLGLTGVGIAMVLSEMLSAVGGLCYIYMLKPYKYFIHWPCDPISWRYIKRILWNSWLVGLQFGVEGVYLFLLTIIVGWVSIEAQTVHTILLNICQLITIFSVGLGLSGSMLVAQQRGNQNGCLVRKVALVACFIISMGSILIVFFLLTISSRMISFYKPVEDVRNLTHLLIKHLCIFQLFYSICCWGNGVLRGLDDRIFPFLSSLLTQLIGVVVSYLLAIKYKLGIHGIWVTLIVERMLLSLSLIIRFNYKTKT